MENLLFLGVPILKHIIVIMFPKQIDGWLTCNFKSFSTVLQSYQADGQMIMKGYVQWNPIYGREGFALRGARTWDCSIS